MVLCIFFVQGSEASARKNKHYRIMGSEVFRATNMKGVDPLGCLPPAGFLHGLIFHLEDGHSTFL
jgi:hypothetical protein